LPLETGIYSADYATAVTTPEGETARLDDPKFTQLLEKRYGKKLELRYSERSMMDTFPVSVFGLATVRAISKETGMDLDPLRFRANFYVDWHCDEPYFEDCLVGEEIRIGEAVSIQIVQKDTRCVMITLDPETAAASPVVFETVVRDHRGCIGVYGSVLREGIVRTGDPVYAV
jgi:uncharacterized protein